MGNDGYFEWSKVGIGEAQSQADYKSSHLLLDEGPEWKVSYHQNSTLRFLEQEYEGLIYIEWYLIKIKS